MPDPDDDASRRPVERCARPSRAGADRRRAGRRRDRRGRRVSTERPVEEHVGGVRAGARAAAAAPSTPDRESPAPRPRRLTAVPPRRLRLDAELVRRGLARSREHASELIARRPGQACPARWPTKPATGVTTDVAIVVARGPGPAGLRLARGAQAGRRAGGVRAGRPRWSRDAAAWTRAPRPAGSPTCCCAHGAARGGGGGRRLRPAGLALQQDERVVVHDRTNVRELTAEMIGGPVDLVVGDLSFISLRARAGRAARRSPRRTATWP